MDLQSRTLRRQRPTAVFINIAAEVVGDHVYLFGTEYRRSTIRRAQPGRCSTRRAASRSSARSSARPVTESRRRSLSLRLDFLAEELLPPNRIVAYFALAKDRGASFIVRHGPRAAIRAASEDACSARRCSTARTGFYGTPVPIDDRFRELVQGHVRCRSFLAVQLPVRAVLKGDPSHA
jgi:hypothetical protein